METAIGLMSGTSLDGVDAAVIETDGERVAALGPARTFPYPKALRAELRALLEAGDALDPAAAAVAAATRALTDAHVAAVRALAAETPRSPTLVGFHGQTVLHRPQRGLTWQIGDAQYLAAAVGLPVVHDFRAADVAAGGEGAPLAPLFHAALLPAAVPRPAGVLNIGGVANLTFVPDDPGGLLACDTGPGNALLDDLVAARTGALYDADGALGETGRPDEAILDELLAHPFFARPAPKSLDRLDFAPALARLAPLGDADAAATLAAFTARAVARVPVPAPLQTLVVCGGGRKNRTIMRMLSAALRIPVEPAEAIGWDGDALEAQCFGFLAVRSLRGLPLSLPGTTGVGAPTCGGRLVRPPTPCPPTPCPPTP